MKTIGDKTKFAVSYELAQEYYGTWLLGQCCYWVDGKVVGDYQFHTYLCDMIGALPWIVGDNGKREHEHFFNLSTKEFFKLLDDTLHGKYGDESKYYDIAIEECWARFNICPETDIFHDWAMYLIDSPSVSSNDVYAFYKRPTQGRIKTTRCQ